MLTETHLLTILRDILSRRPEVSIVCEDLIQATNLFSGMFLWVRLVITSLEDCSSELQLIDAVNTLPDGLDEAFVKAVKNVYRLG